MYNLESSWNFAFARVGNGSCTSGTHRGDGRASFCGSGTGCPYREHQIGVNFLGSGTVRAHRERKISVSVRNGERLVRNLGVGNGEQKAHVGNATVASGTFHYFSTLFAGLVPDRIWELTHKALRSMPDWPLLDSNQVQALIDQLAPKFCQNEEEVRTQNTHSKQLHKYESVKKCDKNLKNLMHVHNILTGGGHQHQTNPQH